MRSIGIEEELFLVDVESGRPVSLARQVLHQAARQERTGHAGTGHAGTGHAGTGQADGPVRQSARDDAGQDDAGQDDAGQDDAGRDDAGRDDDAQPGGSLGNELQQQQLETDTSPHTDLDALEAELRAWRADAVKAARLHRARVVAVGTPPVPGEPLHMPAPRYRFLAEKFGMTTAEQLVCGCHVHVSVASQEEAVGVLDRIRVWLPSLLAITANSPFWRGRDSRYASFRSQVMGRWPSAGPTEIFGSARAYRERVEDMVGTGVLLDEGMVYFDARASSTYPTVELRSADVCMHVEDAVLLGALCRALVETAAGEWAAGEAAAPVPASMLRLASWQAGREGIEGTLLDPYRNRPRPAAEVLEALVAHVRPALVAAGDEALVESRLGRVLSRGNGARRQRAQLQRTGQLADVVADAARVTAGQEG